MLKFLAIVPAAAAVLALAAPAGAQELIDAKNPEALADIFRGYGSARLDKAADDTPAIRGRIDGIAFSVYFYGCDDKDVNCTSLNLTASWETKGSVTLDQLNEWNRMTRFARSYLNAEQNAVAETDIDLSGSTTVPNLEAQINWWRYTLTDFQTKVVNAEPAAAPAGGDQPAADAGTGEGNGERRGPFAIPRKPN